MQWAVGKGGKGIAQQLAGRNLGKIWHKSQESLVGGATVGGGGGVGGGIANHMQQVDGLCGLWFLSM